MAKKLRSKMNVSDIPAFVVDVIEAGCDITAVGYAMYVVGDVEEQDAALKELARIEKRYGDRDPIRQEIAAYLRSIGRYIETDLQATCH